MASISTRRLAKELSDIHKECPTGIELQDASNFESWILSIQVLGESLYKGEVFLLKFEFESGYPISSPAVYFIADETHHIPTHPHVYTNGHICASILGHEWSPVLGVASVCITLQSMLASCKNKVKPEDNDRYVKHAPRNPKKTRWAYHDDECVDIEILNNN